MEHFEENQAQLREKLIGELIGLARATEGNEHMLTPTTAAAVVEGLAAALPGGCCDAEVLSAILDRVDREKRKLVPACYSCTASCGRNDAYDMRKLQNLPEHIREMKLRLLAGIQELAAHSCRATEKLPAFSTGHSLPSAWMTGKRRSFCRSLANYRKKLDSPGAFRI